MERVEKSEEQREQPTTRQKRREERVICVGILSSVCKRFIKILSDNLREENHRKLSYPH